jgi:hypothetical protein
VRVRVCVGYFCRGGGMCATKHTRATTAATQVREERSGETNKIKSTKRAGERKRREKAGGDLAHGFVKQTHLRRRRHQKECRETRVANTGRSFKADLPLWRAQLSF